MVTLIGEGFNMWKIGCIAAAHTQEKEMGRFKTQAINNIVQIPIPLYFCPGVSPSILMKFTHIHKCIHTYMHTYIHACIHTYMHTYITTYIHTYITTYIHT